MRRGAGNVRLRPVARRRFWRHLRRLIAARTALIRSWRPSWPWFAERRVFLTWCTAAGVALGGAMLLKQFLEGADAFKVRAVRVSGNHQLSVEEVCRIGRIREGQNAFAVDARAVESRLNRSPWVETAKVWRRLPGTVTVWIRERRPVASLTLAPLDPQLREAPVEPTLLMLSARGDVFNPGDLDVARSLPRVTGIDPQRFAVDSMYRSELMPRIAAVVVDYGRSDLGRSQPLLEVHLQPDHSLELYIGKEAALVRLGQPPYLGKLRRLSAAMRAVDARHAHAEVIYLDHDSPPDRATLRLRSR